MEDTQVTHDQPDWIGPVTSESEVTIYRSFNYDLFSLIEENRSVEHRATVRESVEEIGPLFDAFPILTRWNADDERLEILDGQARFQVAKEEGEPIYFIVKNLPFKYVPVFNSKTTTWETRDYLHWYCTTENEEYLKLRSFNDKYPHLSLNFIRDYGMGGRMGSGSGSVADKFRRGKWEFAHEDLITTVAEYVLDFRKHTSVWKQRKFHTALMHLVKLENADIPDKGAPTKYNHEHMVAQLEKGFGEITPQTGVREYMKEMEEIFRYKQTGWKKRTIFEPQYAKEIEAAAKASLN